MSKLEQIWLKNRTILKFEVRSNMSLNNLTINLDLQYQFVTNIWSPTTLAIVIVYVQM